MNGDDSTGKISLLWMIAVVLMLFLGWKYLWRGRVNTHRSSGLNTIANNLRILEGAKEQWGLEHQATNGTPVTTVDLAPYLKDGQRTLESARVRWYRDHQGTPDAHPTPADLTSYLKVSELIKPAAGEVYSINPAGELITVQLTKKLDYRFEAGSVVTVTSF